jgi:hypothetical protein
LERDVHKKIQQKVLPDSVADWFLAPDGSQLVSMGQQPLSVLQSSFAVSDFPSHYPPNHLVPGI